MRQAQPENQWKFVFNPTIGGGRQSAWLESEWAGDAYVDVVGVDLYDQSWATNTSVPNVSAMWSTPATAA